MAQNNAYLNRSILSTIFGNFGLYRDVPEGRNLSTIKDKEELYQNLENLSIIIIYIIIIM